MANKKVKRCRNFGFLPLEYQKMDKRTLGLTEKNVLATLCYGRLYYSDYARDNDGWFYASLEWIANECSIDVSTVKRTMLELMLKKLVTRKSGKKHQPTHYHLSLELEHLLPIQEIEEEINEPQVNLTQQNVKLTEDNTKLSEVNVLNTVSSDTEDIYSNLPF